MSDHSEESKAAAAEAAKPAKAKVTETKTVIKKEVEPEVGLLADAKAAKPFHESQDKAIADTHQSLRDENKLVTQSPIIGYESARENLELKPEDKTTPEPTNVDSVAPPK